MSVSFAHVVFDSSDAEALARFWAGVLERPVDEGASPFFATVGMPERGTTPTPVFMFLQVPDPTPGKNRVHVDLSSADLPAEVERLTALGATHVADHDEYGTTWTTLADPDGNLFDIAAET
jgi:catechol 2,3-dioxygenase-like lactoylglutathione lyase family enzyme